MIKFNDLDSLIDWIEGIYKKIKEAAENHHPAYDEQAWAKMNKLLDKHMPEKEERRRRFAWPATSTAGTRRRNRWSATRKASGA